jgi:hypothetical protein
MGPGRAVRFTTPQLAAVLHNVQWLRLSPLYIGKNQAAIHGAVSLPSLVHNKKDAIYHYLLLSTSYT